MKDEFWLVRDSDGCYALFRDRPQWEYTPGWFGMGNGGWEWKGEKLFLGELCCISTRKWLNLKRHLPKGRRGIKRVSLEVNCEVLPK